MIDRIIAGALVMCAVVVALAESVGFHFFVRVFCSHPQKRIFWSKGTPICERCGKVVTLWERPSH